MKPAFTLLLLLLTACASSTDIIDERVLPCGSGQDIEVRAGFDDGMLHGEVGGQMKYLVEVANNSHHDVTVKSIRIDPQSERVPGIERAYRQYDQLIAEGEDHVFELPSSEVLNWRSDLDRRTALQRLEFVVVVSLSDGDSYRCRFVAELR